ncbi:dihydroneopterin triphosphate diphosphatase [Roseateles chitinivorans]|uniref:dihydroneopterin triphosphate diphosphatase n=1 Tax=Roseateles chitinivorans TaxID=2917965 RepID=UPI003D6666C8
MSEVPLAPVAAPLPAAAQTASAETAARAYKIPESVLVVIHTEALDVLMLERADRPGFWQCVTGSKDTPEELLSDTARREVLEETGIRAQDLAPGALVDWQLSNVYDIYPVWRHRYAPGVTRNTEHVFGLTVPAGTAVTLAPREHLDFRWLPWREAADLCFSPSNAEAILQLPAQRARAERAAP